MKQKLLNKKETVIWICSTLCRVFGVGGTLVAFSGNFMWAGVCGLINGAAYELKAMLEKQNPGI